LGMAFLPPGARLGTGRFALRLLYGVEDPLDLEQAPRAKKAIAERASVRVTVTLAIASIDCLPCARGRRTAPA
jgi:hypothetical protein